MDASVSPPNYDSIQRQDTLDKPISTVTLKVSKSDLPDTELPPGAPLPAPRQRSVGEHHLTQAALSDADLKMVEMGKADQDGKKIGGDGRAYQWTTTCSLILAQYVCTAAVAHGFAYLRRTATDNGFGALHAGFLVASPLIVTAALHQLVRIPTFPLVWGLSIITISQIALGLVDLAKDEWTFYSHLLTQCLLGIGVFVTEQSLRPFCHVYHRLLMVFLALAVQPMISGYLDQVASYSPALLMALISLTVTLVHLSLQKLRPSKDTSTTILYRTEQSSIAIYEITTLGRQLVLIATFYLIWGKLATMPLLSEFVQLNDDFKPLLFLTFGGCALIISVGGAVAGVNIRRPRIPSYRVTFVAAVIAVVAIACVVVGLLLGSTLVVANPEIWSLFTSKALLGAGLAATAGLLVFLDGNGTTSETSINRWPIQSVREGTVPSAESSSSYTVSSTNCSTTTVTVTTYARTSTMSSADAMFNGGDASSDEAAVLRSPSLTASITVLGASTWPLISVGGWLGVVVSTAVAAHHDHWIVNVVDLVVFLVPAALLIGESLWLWRRKATGGVSTILASETETSKL